MNATPTGRAACRGNRRAITTGLRGDALDNSGLTVPSVGDRVETGLCFWFRAAREPQLVLDVLEQFVFGAERGVGFDPPKPLDQAVVAAGGEWQTGRPGGRVSARGVAPVGEAIDGSSPGMCRLSLLRRLTGEPPSSRTPDIAAAVDALLTQAAFFLACWTPTRSVRGTVVGSTDDSRTGCWVTDGVDAGTTGSGCSARGCRDGAGDPGSVRRADR